MSVEDRGDSRRTRPSFPYMYHVDGMLTAWTNPGECAAIDVCDDGKRHELIHPFSIERTFVGSFPTQNGTNGRVAEATQVEVTSHWWDGGGDQRSKDP